MFLLVDRNLLENVCKENETSPPGSSSFSPLSAVGQQNGFRKRSKTCLILCRAFSVASREFEYTGQSTHRFVTRKKRRKYEHRPRLKQKATYIKVLGHAKIYRVHQSRRRQTKLELNWLVNGTTFGRFRTGRKIPLWKREIDAQKVAKSQHKHSSAGRCSR